MSKNLYEIVDDFRPKQPTDLIPIADHYKIFEYASCASFVASHVHELHQKKISDKNSRNKASYGYELILGAD